MDGVHDMGGMHGFGPVIHEDNEPVFHEPWEGHVYAFIMAIKSPLFPILDAARHALENLPPAQYLGSSYYERWLLRAERRLIERGSITQHELDERVAFYREHPDAPVPSHSDPAIVDRARKLLTNPVPRLDRPDGAPPCFKVGDFVRTKNIHPAGHTRLPGYAREKVGVISRVHGSHTFPDAAAHGLGDQPQGVSSVRFEARELWGEYAEGCGAVFIDLWDSYLEPADRPA